MPRRIDTGAAGAYKYERTMPCEPSELALVRRCVNGDESAWHALHRTHAPRLLGRLVRFLQRRGRPAPQQDEAEEVLARIFSSLVEDDFALLRGFRGESSLGGWLSVVAVRRAQNYLRSEAREHARRPQTIGPRAPAEGSPLDRLEREEARALLREASKDLSPRDRLILRLHFIESLPYGEIASTLRVSANSVGPLVKRAAERLRTLLERK